MGLWNLKRINDLYNHIRKTYKNPKLLKDSKWQIDLVKKASKVEEFRLMINALKGKKTYLVGILMFALGGLKALGVVDDATYDTIMGLLVGLGLVAVRAGITNK